MFCDRIVWIEDGLVREEGAPAKVLAHYGHGLETAEDISPTAIPMTAADLRVVGARFVGCGRANGSCTGVWS